jgi:hypothetical protein
MSNNLILDLQTQIEEHKFQIEELKFQNSQLKLLYGNAVEQQHRSVAVANAKTVANAETVVRPPIVMSVAGDYVSVFEDDSNIVPHVEEPDEDDVESTSLNVYWATSFIKEKAKRPRTKYNKARYTASCRACQCGGKTSTINSHAMRHENSRKHQIYLLEQAYASSEYVGEEYLVSEAW